MDAPDELVEAVAEVATATWPSDDPAKRAVCGCGSALFWSDAAGWVDHSESTICDSEGAHEPLTVEDIGREFGLTRHHVDAARVILRARIAAARALLSVPALAEVIARDAKVQEIVEALADFKVVLPDAGPEFDARSMHDVFVLYPEAGK